MNTPYLKFKSLAYPTPFSWSGDFWRFHGVFRKKNHIFIFFLQEGHEDYDEDDDEEEEEIEVDEEDNPDTEEEEERSIGN